MSIVRRLVIGVAVAALFSHLASMPAEAREPVRNGTLSSRRGVPDEWPERAEPASPDSDDEIRSADPAQATGPLAGQALAGCSSPERRP